MIGLHSPFSNYLEAPTSIANLYSRFGAGINDGLQQTEAAIEGLLAAVLGELHGLPANRTVSDDDLRRNGFDPSTPWPDESDYW
ncbi:MAG: hypothetical protein IPL45_00040 [Actinomycetales bacterium]|nr:hypothetical protein [Actinomycetales bacterium]